MSEKTGTVADISDEDLVHRAMLKCRNSRKKLPRWVIVSDLFGLGSTYSIQLCKRFGLDPDAPVSPPRRSS